MGKPEVFMAECVWCATCGKTVVYDDAKTCTRCGEGPLCERCAYIITTGGKLVNVVCSGCEQKN